METLLVGNTDYITKNFIQTAFPRDHVMVLGNLRLHSDKKSSLVSMKLPEKEDISAVFESYEFDKVVIFSNHLSFHTRREGELEYLRQILQLSAGQKKTRVVYLTSTESRRESGTGKTVLARAAFMLCRYYGETKGLDVKVIRAPYLYSGTCPQDFLYQTFEKIRRGEKPVFQESPEQRAGFLCIDDLGELFLRLFDGWKEGMEVLDVPDAFDITYGQLADRIRSLTGAEKIAFASAADQNVETAADQTLRSRYGWFPHISILEDLPDVYAEYQKQLEAEKSRGAKILEWIRSQKNLLKLLELFAGFLLMEGLNQLAGNSVQFRMIDLRLVFIVLMSTIYGMNIGTAAAALESAALVASYTQSGIGWMTLFYEPTNWIPFIFYFVVAAMCGYRQLKNRDEIRFAKKENELIQEKYFFMQQLYQDTLQDKREYKRQIIGSRDSFGKIFDVTRKLDVVRPQEIFIQSISVMEKILENQSIAVYSIGSNGNFARLEAASRMQRGKQKNSLELQAYNRMLSTLEKGEVWANTELLPDYPAYCAGIMRGDRLMLLIMVCETSYGQMSMYYQNLIKILCGLIESAMLRALDYQQSVREDQYLDGMNIMKEPAFLETLQLRHSMLEQMIADYVLIRLDRGNMDLESADRILRRIVRENDIVGTSDSGYLYLIASQATPESVPFVIERLEKAGFGCKVVPQTGEE